MKNRCVGMRCLHVDKPAVEIAPALLEFQIVGVESPAFHQIVGHTVRPAVAKEDARRVALHLYLVRTGAIELRDARWKPRRHLDTQLNIGDDIGTPRKFNIHPSAKTDRSHGGLSQNIPDTRAALLIVGAEPGAACLLDEIGILLAAADEF